MILPITHDAIVLDRGQIVHAAPSAELLADREQLDRWLAVRPDVTRRGPRCAHERM